MWLFHNSSERVNPNELKFFGMNSLGGVQMIIGYKTSGFDQPFAGKSNNADEASGNPPYIQFSPN